MKLILTLLLLLFSFTFTFAQIKNNKKQTKNPNEKVDLDKNRLPSFFGFQARTIVPSSFIGEQSFNSFSYLNDNQTDEKYLFNTEFSQIYGYSLGTILRVGITKLIAFETGVNYNKHRFLINSSYIDSGFYEENVLRFVHYEIPLNGLVYIQLFDQFYANVTMGGLIGYSPSIVRKVQYFNGVNHFVHDGLIPNRFTFKVDASIGFEYRTEKNGIFYLGGSAVVPLLPLFVLRNSYKYSENIVATDNHLVKGGYLSLDLKYFLPTIKNKGTQFTKGPID